MKKAILVICLIAVSVWAVSFASKEENADFIETGFTSSWYKTSNDKNSPHFDGFNRVKYFLKAEEGSNAEELYYSRFSPDYVKKQKMQ